MKRNLFFFIFAIFGGLLATYAWAAPNISSVNGTISHNQSVIISGTGFGTKAVPAPVLWDTVDNIASYYGLSDGETIPVGGANPWPSPYGNSSGNDFVKYNTSDAQRGVSTAQYKATNIRGGYLDGLTWPATNYAYVSWWWKTDTNVSGTNHSSKFLRMSDASNEVNKTFSWTQMQAIVYSNPNYCANVWPSFNGNPNNWNFLEAWFDNTNQTFTIRVNGTILTSTSWTSCSSFTFNELWKIGFDGGGVSPPSITWWMDDIYVDNSFSRVILGNASTYAASTHLEIQIPTVWSNTSVSVKVNTGVFAANQQAYFYVVDADGNVNTNGYPIVIGGGSGDSFPSVNITSPTSATTYATSQDTIAISGTASDDDAISSITWSNDRGGSGIANNDSGDWRSWSIENIALLEGDNVITVTATDSADQTSADTITVTYSSEPVDNAPNVNISTPTSATTYATSQDIIAISGSALDDDAISSITWSNDRGDSGTAINGSGDWASWSIEKIALQEEDNVITVTATDSTDQTSSDTITVTSSDIVQVWSATAQTGDSAFKDSVVTYCVRLLIEGDQVTQSGSTVRLGFQGRSSGDYTIRKVSVAERDMGSAEGDVIDSTWTRVTFDGNSEVTWVSDVITVAAGAEKLSDPISFTLQAGKDYYITFKIDTPSLYLNPPVFYRELYFSSADHTEDIDWSGNGHSITQDYHALSKIYAISGETPSVPSAPFGLTVAVSE